MAFRCPATTKSGFPGKSRAQLRYLIPIPLSIARTVNSGCVPRERTRRIISLRWLRENMSIAHRLM
jgi:hypothetical protein